jgi:uncharacterized protein (TIGR00255 family)
MKSMTGFGRGEAEDQGRLFVVEIKTVNNRFLETNVRIGRQLSALELMVRDQIRSRLSRGKVDVSIQYENHSDQQGQVWINQAKMKAYVENLRQAAAEAGVEDDLKLSHLLALPDVIESKPADDDPEALGALLEKALGQALDHLEEMREKEGETLHKDFSDKLDQLEAIVVTVEERAPLVVTNYKEKLYARLDQYLDPEKTAEVDPGRLETEITIFSDRCCIDEELTRLHSHIGQFRQLLKSQEPVGRQLDFLTQELNRETNTIASKSNDLEITRNALAMKNLIEKIREQIQNIE